MMESLRTFHLGLECDTLPEAKSTGVSYQGIPEHISELTKADMKEGKDIVEGICEAEEDHALLQKLYSSVSSKVENGEALSAGTATLLEHTLESIYRRYGYPYQQIIAVESFNNPRLAYKSTKIACESLLDMMKSVGEWLVKNISNFGKWVSKTWHKLQASLLKSKDALFAMREELRSYNSIPEAGNPTPVNTNGSSFNIYSENYLVKWSEVHKQLTNVLSGCELYNKAIETIRAFFKNANKPMDKFANSDPFNLKKYSPFLGMGKFIGNVGFSSNFDISNNKLRDITIPTYNELKTFLDDACTLVDDRAISQLKASKDELESLVSFVTDYKTQQALEVDPTTGHPVTTTVEIPEIKLEYKQAIKMSEYMLNVFWDLRNYASQEAVRLVRYIMDKHVVP